MQENEKKHRLNSAIDDWRQWPLPLQKRPQVLSQLRGGDINASFVIGNKEKKWTLKLFGNSAQPERKDKIESLAQQEAHQLGIAAALLYSNEKQHYQISEFIAGETLQEIEKKNPPQSQTQQAAREAHKGLHKTREAILPALIPVLTKAIEKLQEASIDIPQIIYAERLSAHWEEIPRRHRTTLEAQYQRALQQAKALDQSTEMDEAVLCHHDLNPGNILIASEKESGASSSSIRSSLICPSLIRPFLIDWEFAVRGPATMDFAILSVELGCDIEKLSQLSGHSQSSLILAADVYRALCLLYNAAQEFQKKR